MATQTNGKSAAPPSQTLYIKNLPDRLPKQELRYSLYGLFSMYGPVLDVVALKTIKMRGQAHIVFRDTQASSQAMRSLQGFDFFGKEMKISYARGKSNMISWLDGSVKESESKQTTKTSLATETQKSVFNNPNALELQTPLKTTATVNRSKSPQGVKRRRDDDDDDDDDDDNNGDDGDNSEENDDTPMEVDEEGEAMDESDDD